MPATPKYRTAALGVGAVAVTVIVAYVLWGAGAPAEPVYRLRPNDTRLRAMGERVYSAQCAACHGARLEGQANWRERGLDGKLPAPPHDASGHTWHHDDELLFRITKHGVAKAANLKDYASAMPAYDGVLSDEEIVAALSWIKSQWPAQIRSRHDDLNRANGR